MRKVFRKIHRCYYLVLVFLFFILLYPILWWAARNKEKYYSLLVKVRGWIALPGATLAGIIFKIDEERPVDWSKTYLICSNHTSNLDITALICACKQDFSFMGKEDLMNNPITGLFFKTIDIPVNRLSKVSSFRAYKKAQEQLMKGRSVVIFPEGGIFDDYPPFIHPFKNGIFKLATDLNISILPIVVHDAWKICWDDGKIEGTSPGVCHISVLTPIESGSFTADGLRESVYERFQEVWNLKNK